MVQLDKIKEFLKKRVLGIRERERIQGLKYYFNELKNKEEQDKIDEEIEDLDEDLKHYRKLLHEDIKISQEDASKDESMKESSITRLEVQQNFNFLE
ncbi:MAG: hypothetical protein ACTSRH_11170 [Promethearchaeota archaeon]